MRGRCRVAQSSTVGSGLSGPAAEGGLLELVGGQEGRGFPIYGGACALYSQVEGRSASASRILQAAAVGPLIRRLPGVLFEEGLTSSAQSRR
jgi:hypothetical protein